MAVYQLIQYFKYTCFSFIFLFFALDLASQNLYRSRYRVTTTLGSFTLALFKETPLHARQFKRLVQQGYYSGLLFHRAIPEFVIQGGDPLSKTARTGDSLGHGDLGYTVPVELHPNLFHQYGVVGMARESDEINPTRASSACQFYVVVGKKRNPEQLKFELQRIAQKRSYIQWLKDSVKIQWDTISDPQHFRMQELQKLNQGYTLTLSNSQFKAYTSWGGIPHLDGRYTVFGLVINGMDVVERISNSNRDKRDRPYEDIRFSVERIRRWNLFSKKSTHH
jgi:peptidylprolyl isomerase